MARPLPTTAPQSDTTSINLDRILSRLENTLLSTTGDPKLRTSAFERNKVGANLEHARSLLLRLEHDSADIRIQSQKLAVQTALQAKRERIKRLAQRLYELNQLDDSDGEESEGSDSEDFEGEDLFPSYAPARTDVSTGIEAAAREEVPGREAIRNAAEGLTSSIRARRTNTAATASAGTPTAVGTSTGTATGNSLFSTSKGKAKATTDTDIAGTEAKLSHDRHEQEEISSAMVTMARLLKENSQRFQQALQEDSDVLKRTAGTMEKSSTGMDAAGRRMGTLRRMTEGKGWWARLQLYALIAGLWFVAFAIVFILPKFRF